MPYPLNGLDYMDQTTLLCYIIYHILIQLIYGKKMKSHKKYGSIMHEHWRFNSKAQTHSQFTLKKKS